MLPQYEDDLRADFVLAGRQTSRTYQLNTEKQQIRGIIDGKEAVEQAIYKILNTERYQYVIYSWNYGVELADLIGHPIPYVYSEIKDRITDALMQDDRIESIGHFLFNKKRNAVHVTFTVHSIFGEIPVEREVQI